MKIQQSILSGLIHSPDFVKRCASFLKEEYFSGTESDVFRIISSYIEKYNEPPTITSLQIMMELDTKMSGEAFDECAKYFDMISEPEQINLEYLLKETEKYCQDKSIENALYKSFEIVTNKNSKHDRGYVPKLLNDALAVSFDTSVGHSFLDNIDDRYNFYHKNEEKIPFDLDIFNKITEGGLPNKTLNVVLAGCVHPDTNVNVLVDNKNSTIRIGDIENLLKTTTVKVESPDGWVDVNYFIDKGLWDEYLLTLSDGRVVSVNRKHMFETDCGWQFAEDLVNKKTDFLCDCGWLTGVVTVTGNKIPIVDINVEHENHRYYTNGVSSHNTGVGKSLFMTHCAAANLKFGKNVLYITLEMSEERVAERIDANLMDINIRDVKNMSREEFSKRLIAMKSKYKGNIIIKEYPTTSAHAGHFKFLLEELKTKRKFKPDIVYVDYINICASSRMKSNGDNSYTRIKSIAEELRGLAMEYDIPIITATQTTRGSYKSSDIDLTDTSECICVDENITLVDGTIKKIGDVKLGDQITANDNYKTVAFIHHKKIKDCVKIKTKSGKEIIVSRDHVFPCKDKDGNVSRQSVNDGLDVGFFLSVK